MDKQTGTRDFVCEAWGRVIAGSEDERAQRGQNGASASDVKAEFIWALPPAANDNGLYGGGDHIGGYAPLALVAEMRRASSKSNGSTPRSCYAGIEPIFSDNRRLSCQELCRANIGPKNRVRETGKLNTN